MTAENGERGMGMGMGMSETLACRSRGCDQDREELVGFIGERRVHSHPQTKAESKPVDGLAHLLCGHGHFVNEVCATLGTARFFIVGACGRDGAHELLPDVAAGHVARNRAGQSNATHGKAHQSFRNIVTNHTCPSARTAAELRIPIPIPCSTFSS